MSQEIRSQADSHYPGGPHTYRPDQGSFPMVDSDRSSHHHEIARIYFWIAFISFTAALAGWGVHTLLSGWMEVAGVMAIGLFYLGLGLLELGR